MKRTISAIGRYVLEKMDIAAMYVERLYSTKKAIHVHRKKNHTDDVCYVYFCIECKLYEFLTYMIYIWTKNISRFICYCTLL